VSVAIANVPAVLVFGMAAALAWFDKPGWGWLAFAGFCLIILPREKG
jgi:uncharacterized membrane protein YhhN